MACKHTSAQIWNPTKLLPVYTKPWPSFHLMPSMLLQLSLRQILKYSKKDWNQVCEPAMMGTPTKPMYSRKPLGSKICGLGRLGPSYLKPGFH